MSAISPTIDPSHSSRLRRESQLAPGITKTASRQTYYTIRFLADRERVADAYRAYAYFRWVDDHIDNATDAPQDHLAFLQRQQALLEDGYRGTWPGDPWPGDLCPEEQMLADMIRNDGEVESGLQAYLRNMMAVMAFDAGRRGRLISATELDDYSRTLATAVSEALFHFIGHDDPTPRTDARYLAVRGAHIIHMLRDMVEDCAVGYFNFPAEYLEAHGLSIDDRDQPAYREWVARRVALARDCFRQGRAYIDRVGNRRCRLAGYAYIARFEWMASLIERDGYCLRAEYPERKSFRAGLWMAGRAAASF